MSARLPSGTPAAGVPIPGTADGTGAPWRLVEWAAAGRSGVAASGLTALGFDELRLELGPLLAFVRDHRPDLLVAAGVYGRETWGDD